MKRNVTEIIRRGFESVIANWPLLLIRIGEGIFAFVLIIAAIVAAVIPLLMSLGVQKFDPKTPEDIAEFILSIFTDHWMIFVYLFLLMTFVLLVYVAVHAFVEGGSARIYVDAERANKAVPQPGRQQLRVFTADRWIKGAKQAWWSVFWIYNIAWGVGGLIMLAPMIVVAAMMLIARDSPAALVGIGCVGGAFSFLFMFLVLIVTYIWSTKAIVYTAATGEGASASLGESWREFKADAARHIGVTLILFVLTVVGSGVLSSFGMAFGWQDSPMLTLTTMPLQMVGSLLNTIFSAIMASWMLACFAALTVELRRA